MEALNNVVSIESAKSATPVDLVALRAQLITLDPKVLNKLFRDVKEAKGMVAVSEEDTMPDAVKKVLLTKENEVFNLFMSDNSINVMRVLSREVKGGGRNSVTHMTLVNHNNPDERLELTSKDTSSLQGVTGFKYVVRVAK